MASAALRTRLALVLGLELLLAVGLAAGLWLRAERGEANVGTPTMQFQLSGNSGISCDDPQAPTKCSVPLSGTFNLDVAVTAFPDDPDGPSFPLTAGYIAMRTDIEWTGTALTYNPQPNPVEVPWPDRGNIVTTSDGLSPTRISHGDLSMHYATIPSTFKGVVVRLQFTCSAANSTNSVLLIPYDPSAEPTGASLADALGFIFPTSDSITINCQPPQTPTPCPGPCPTATNTRTATSTSTRTPTPTRTQSPTPCPPGKVPIFNGCGTPTPTRTPCPDVACSTPTGTRTPTPTACPSCPTPTTTRTPTPTATPCVPGSTCPEMTLNVKSPAGQCDDPIRPTKCTLPNGTTFTLSIAASRPPSGGYVGFQTDLLFDTLFYQPAPFKVEEVVWPEAFAGAYRAVETGRVTHGSLSGGSLSHYEGNIVQLAMTCVQVGTASVRLLPYSPDSNPGGSQFALPNGFQVAATSSDPNFSAKLDINCAVLPTFTPAATRTPTRTSTPVPTPSGAPAMSLNATGPAVQCDHPTRPTKCAVPLGGIFSLEVAVDSFPADPDGSGPGLIGYIAMDTDIDWTGTALTYKPQANALEVPWPDRANIVTSSVTVFGVPNRIQHGDISRLGVPPSTFTGVVVRLQFTCGVGESTNSVRLLPWDPGFNPGGASLADDSFTPDIFPTSDTLTINCVAGPAATATPTPTPVMRMQKLPVLQNLFLTRQGAKIPPPRCLDSTNAAILTESISLPVTGADPKDPSQPRHLGGFSFQVKYDQSKVCLTLRPGPAWTANRQQVCVVEDSATAPALQGIARINCVTLGKATAVDTSTATGRALALIEVRPQPELYSQIRPDQDNGQAVTLSNEACKLTDLQGHAIPVFSCDDAHVTIRFLEGDVEPDCQVNTLDTQSIAFRWGAQKGSLVYGDRFNLEPSGTQRDQDIDVNDLQFVYGRFGSTCAAPWPRQEPVNPAS